MKNVLNFLLVATLMLLIAACSGDGSNSQTPTAAKTTVLIYIEGTNLESVWDQATGNIKEMLAAASAPHLNVVLTTGAADKAVADDPVKSWRTVKRHQIKDGKITELADLGTLDMGSPQVLTDFITWGQSTFPADKYILIFWDHGGGTNGGYGGDLPTNTSTLSIPRLTRAVQDAVKTTGKKFELIGFDACLMATAEIAYYLEPVANYLAASEELEPGPGWNYTPFLNAIALNPATDGLSAGTAIADGYAAKSKQETEDYTFSVIDLSRIGGVLTALQQFSENVSLRMEQNRKATWKQLAVARNRADEYGADYINFRFTNLMEIGHFVRLLGDSDAGWQPVTTVLGDAVKRAVRYNVAGAAHESSTGLSLYFPSHDFETAQTTLLTYAQTPFDLQYFNLMSQFVTYPLRNPPGKAFAVTSPIQSGMTIQATATSPLGLAEQYVAFISSAESDDNSIVLLGMDLATATQTAEDSYRLSYTRTDSWFTLGGNQVTVFFESLMNNGQYLISIPVLYRPAGSQPSDRRPVNIALTYNPTTNIGTIYSAWEGIQPDGVVNRVSVRLREGDLITPVFEKITLQASGQDLIEYLEGTEFMLTEETRRCSRTRIPAGSYELAFLVQDLGGNTEASSLIGFTVTAVKSSQKQRIPAFVQQGFWSGWK